MKKNPLEGKEVRMAEGISYTPFCSKCKKWSWGFHIVQDGEKFDERDVEGCGCVHCGKSNFIKWIPEGRSVGKIVMKKGWKAKRPEALRKGK